MLPIVTERLILRPFKSGDLERFVAYLRKPEVAIYQSWSDYSDEDAEAFYDQQRELTFDTNDTWYQVAIMRTEDECLVGDVAVHFFDEGRQVEMGFTVDSDYQKQGYATEAIFAVLNLLFTTLNKHRVLAVCDAQNVGAQRLLDRLGFRQEAAFRKNVFFKGVWGDEATYAMLRDECKKGFLPIADHSPSVDFIPVQPVEAVAEANPEETRSLSRRITMACGAVLELFSPMVPMVWCVAKMG